MRLLILLCSVLLLVSCGHKEVPQTSVLERATEAGTIVAELPTSSTFDRKDLPAGITPDEVAAIITLKDDPITTFPGESAGPVTFDKAKPTTTKRAERRIIVTKKGEVLAGVAAQPQVENVEKIKPSYTWVLWVVMVLVIALIFAYVTGKLTAIVQAVLSVFKRK